MPARRKAAKKWLNLRCTRSPFHREKAKWWATMPSLRTRNGRRVTEQSPGKFGLDWVSGILDVNSNGSKYENNALSDRAAWDHPCHECWNLAAFGGGRAG